MYSVPKVLLPQHHPCKGSSLYERPYRTASFTKFARRAHLAGTTCGEQACLLAAGITALGAFGALATHSIAVQRGSRTPWALTAALLACLTVL